MERILVDTGFFVALGRSSDAPVDFADAALVWLAEQTENRSILTVDDADFLRFRLKGGARFELVPWRA